MIIDGDTYEALANLEDAVEALRLHMISPSCPETMAGQMKSRIDHARISLELAIRDLDEAWPSEAPRPSRPVFMNPRNWDSTLSHDDQSLDPSE